MQIFFHLSKFIAIACLFTSFSGAAPKAKFVVAYPNLKIKTINHKVVRIRNMINKILRVNIEIDQAKLDIVMAKLNKCFEAKSATLNMHYKKAYEEPKKQEQRL